MPYETQSAPRRADLRDRIRDYVFFDADIGASRLTRATPVRPQQFLQLILEGDHVLRNLATGHIVRSGRATLIGLCTYRKYNLEVSGRLRLLFVQFQPGALNAWSGLDVRTLTDTCLDARRVWGDAVHDLVDALAAERDTDRGVALADAWFAARPSQPLDDIARAGRRIRDAQGEVPLDPPEGLSSRQVQRRFARQVGVTPKRYARLCRLAAVLDMHDAEPGRSWTSLAHENGYCDQAHLTREFREFVRDTPSRFRRYQPGHTSDAGPAGAMSAAPRPIDALRAAVA